MTFVDTNVLLDLVPPAKSWFDWSSSAVAQARSESPLMSSHIVLAELAAGPLGADGGPLLLRGLAIEIDPIDEAVAIRAGQAHRAYRRSGGERTAILADFLIGAHAAVRGVPLITRDRQRFASYFPELTIIAPESQS